MEGRDTQRSSLYDESSTQSRGRKPRVSQNAIQSRSLNTTVRRWDAASRSHDVWDNLRKDPELWFPDGDCYVYLHSEGQSRRGPSFKVPYLTLLKANCQPLLETFASKAQLRLGTTKDYDDVNTTTCSEHSIRDPVELFIPAPPSPVKNYAYHYHLATRNLFAFVFQKPVVGEYLGGALIALLHTLNQFRIQGIDNIKDTVAYIDKEGYSELNGQPVYALAMLRLAEAFQLRDIYINSFAHCCGMGDQVFLVPESELLSSATSGLIRCTRFEMHTKLVRASTVLKAFLYDETCDIDLGLCPGARRHVEQFRALLRGLYRGHFDYYPPKSNNMRSKILRVEAFQAMRRDFQALHDFLVDESVDISQAGKPQPESNMCVLRSIKSFDARYNCKPLTHPVPLLPDIPRRKLFPWGSSLWSRHAKRNSSQLAVALSVATNWYRFDVAANSLVSAYREFEESQTSPATKADKLQKLGPIDGRKIRWILIYAIYQTLRQATEVAAEIKDTTGASYHLCISTAQLPPWEGKESVQTLTPGPLDQALMASPPPLSPSLGPRSNNDGFVGTRAGSDTKTRHKSTVPEASSWRTNFADSVSRKAATLRRSLSVFNMHELARPSSRAQQTPYHGALSRKHGNGASVMAEDKGFASRIAPADAAHKLSRNGAGSSTSEVSNSSNYSSHSGYRTPGASDTSVVGSLQAPTEKTVTDHPAASGRHSFQDASRSTNLSSSRWPRYAHAGSFQYRPMKQIIPFDREKRSTLPKPRPASVQVGRAYESLGPVNTCGPKAESVSGPGIGMPALRAPTAWDYVQVVMEVQASHHESHTHREGAQSRCLGDFVEVGSETPMRALSCRRASTLF